VNEAAVVPLQAAAIDRDRPGPGETLLVIDIVNAEGLLIVQTIWAVTPDRRRGRRITREVRVKNHAALTRVLAELTPLICWDPLQNTDSARLARALA
jgi:hypothetical protein